MNLINKEFIDLLTNDKFKIIDIYQNIAITNEREKIHVDRLLDSTYYKPLTLVQNQGMQGMNEGKKFEINIEDEKVDPSTFLQGSSINLLDQLSNAVKAIPEDKLPIDDLQVSGSDSMYGMPSDESAIIIDNSYDEKAEILKKYGVIESPDLKSQNEKFSKFLDEDTTITNDTNDNSRQVEVRNSEDSPTQNSNGHIPFQQDPITIMFKNVKRTIDLKIDLEIENKIPRLDFIEMMEDSYEISIIEYLSNEFTKNLLQNPEEIKKMISDKIRKMVSDSKKGDLKDSKDSKESSPKSIVEDTPSTPKSPVTRRKSKKVKDDTRNIPEKSS